MAPSLSDVLPSREAKPIEIPPDVKAALDRGRKSMLKDAPKRRLCARFERGDTYWYLNDRQNLSQLPTATGALGNSGKPPHRIRNTYNFIRPLVEDKVSSSTQRVPSYEIRPTGIDETVVQAAALAEKVALYGYDQWKIRHATMKVVKSAVGQGGDGFAMPWFDTNVGPFEQVQGQQVGKGEIRVMTFGGNEVYWEPGVDFDDSRWYAIERAQPIEDVKDRPGYIIGKLSPDASTSDIPNDRSQQENMVMVTDVFERPCRKYPEGRRMVLAGGRVIVDNRLLDSESEQWWEPYPYRDHDGQVVDEPLIHRLSYTIDPESGRDLGLTWQLIDAQRTIQDCFNKILEWKNRCLNPQMVAQLNSLLDNPNDIPGFINYYRPGTQPPTWQQTPPIPQELFQLVTTMRDAMTFIASYGDVQADPNVAAKTVDTVTSLAQGRWQSFLGDLAEFHSRLMRHCLLLVANYYEDPRLLEVRGEGSWENIDNFKGAHLEGQVNVRVLPGSLASLTRDQIQATLTWLGQMFPGWMTPEMALSVLENGNVQQLIESYLLDKAKANRIIKRIKDGSVMGMPTTHMDDPLTGEPMMQPIMDPTTGQPAIGPDGQPAMEPQEVPSYMPQPDVDNLEVWLREFADFAKTEEYERLDSGLQEVVKQVMAGIRMLQRRDAQLQAQQQTAMAEAQGMQNAAAPQTGKAMPSQPGGPPPAAPPET